MATYAGRNIDEIIIERETVEDKPVTRFIVDERGNLRPVRD